MKGLDYVRLQSNIAFDNDLEYVSDGAFRTFVELLATSAYDLSDGKVLTKRLRKICNSADVQNSLLELESKGFVSTDGDTIVITNYSKYNPTRAEIEDMREKNRRYVRAYRAKTKGLTQDLVRGTEEEEEVESIKPPSSPTSKGTTEQWELDFDVFWSKYPRKVGKPAAKKAYRGARKKTDATTIYQGLVMHIPYWQARNEIEFVPHASTWLNQERWADRPGGAEDMDPELALAIAENQSTRRVR